MTFSLPDRDRAKPKRKFTNALRFAVMIGSLLFAINHGPALLKGEMTYQRWFSAALGFGIPFATGVYCPCAQVSNPQARSRQ